MRLVARFTPNQNTMTNENRILRPKEVAEMLGITTVTLNRYAKRPDFPKKITLSPRHTGYYLKDIKAYLDSMARG
jgi:predicted DNA-binding transcriptional regulator AlpA